MEIKDLQHGVNVHREDGIAVLTMHNPEKRNAFSPAIRDGLITHVEALMRDESCRALVLQGSGGTFCSGGDISTFEDRPAMAARRAMAQSHRYVRALITGGKPVIAAVEGYAFGGGLGLALCCDQVVAARDAKFCASFARVGLMPDIGLLWTLPQRVGLGVAKEMLMLATGLARTWWGMKGAAWYWAQPLLHAKVTLLVVIGLLSIVPTVRFVRWRRALRASGALPSDDALRSTRRLVMIETHLVAVIPLAAVFLARGYGA